LRMFRDSMLVLEKQRPYVDREASLGAAMREGRRWVCRIHGEGLASSVLAHVRAGRWAAAWEESRVLLRHDPVRLLRRFARPLRRRWSTAVLGIRSRPSMR
jgi:hypothetical protein